MYINEDFFKGHNKNVEVKKETKIQRSIIRKDGESLLSFCIEFPVHGNAPIPDDINFSSIPKKLLNLIHGCDFIEDIDYSFAITAPKIIRDYDYTSKKAVINLPKILNILYDKDMVNNASIHQAIKNIMDVNKEETHIGSFSIEFEFKCLCKTHAVSFEEFRKAFLKFETYMYRWSKFGSFTYPESNEGHSSIKLINDDKEPDGKETPYHIMISVNKKRTIISNKTLWKFASELFNHNMKFYSKEQEYQYNNYNAVITDTHMPLYIGPLLRKLNSPNNSYDAKLIGFNDIDGVLKFAVELNNDNKKYNVNSIKKLTKEWISNLGRLTWIDMKSVSTTIEFYIICSELPTTTPPQRKMSYEQHDKALFFDITTKILDNSSEYRQFNNSQETNAQKDAYRILQHQIKVMNSKYESCKDD